MRDFSLPPSDVGPHGREASALRLVGKVALVSGAGRGIGRAIALALARQGAHVALNYHVSRDSARETAEEIRELGQQAVTIQADVSKEDDVQRMVGRTIHELGRLDILVNNAAVFSSTPLLELSAAEWDRIIDINLKSVFLCCQAAARVMLEQGSGVIINVSSGGGLGPDPGYPVSLAYAASKAGVIRMTKRLAQELGPSIRVNGVAPGVISSKAKPMSKTMVDRISRLAPLGRVGEMADIADVVVFLASDEARYMTGQTLSVDGGIIML